MTAAKTPLPDRRLVVSIHDVSPAFEDPIDRLADMIGDILGGPRFAMLVVPDHWGAAPLDREAGPTQDIADHVRQAIDRIFERGRDVVDRHN